MPIATPSTNRGLPFRARGFTTVSEGLDYAARGETGFNFFSARGELETVLAYRDLRDRAVDLAPRMGAADLARGDRVGIVAETSADFLEVFFACQYAGLVPVPLPLCVNFGGRDAYVARLAGMVRAAGVRLVVGSTDFTTTLAEVAAATGVPFASAATLRALASSGAVDPLRADEACYIQYSSGSTSLPKGVLVSQRALTANAQAIAVDGLALTSGDRCASWLPLYHDMGLVGCCLTPVLAQIPVDFLATASFARRPLTWLKLLSEQGGTIAFSPTFGYELCARRGAGSTSAGEFDLRRWRVAGIGAEMIRPRPLNAFAETFAASGFDSRAFVASYGLAEATLAVSMAPLGKGISIDVVEQGEAFQRLGLATSAADKLDRADRRTRAFAVCGRPLEGYSIEIRDPSGKVLGERSVGRVCVKGPSINPGYLGDPEATRRAVLADGWLDTGDLGYLIGGQLVITGRSKDLIILNGRNIWPQDIEWAVEQVAGVRSGDVAAFASIEDDGEQLVVVVQCRARDAADQEELRRDVAAIVRQSAGADARIVLVPVRSLTFTTSGKLSRAAAREDFERGVLRDLGVLAGQAANDQTRAILELAG
jgi:fatty-acyl-CoA synthase